MMNKAIIVIGLLLLVILGGCTAATTEQKVKTITASENAALKEATSSFVDDSSTVEIGEMI